MNPRLPKVREPVTHVIDDDFGEPHEYSVTMHPAGASLRLMRKLAKLIGGPSARGFEGLVGGGSLAGALTGDVSGGVNGIGDAVERFADLLAEHGDEAIFKEILQHTTRDGISVPAHFDRIYQGSLLELFQALTFALKVNYGPLFAALPAQVAKVMHLINSRPRLSSNDSGES